MRWIIATALVAVCCMSSQAETIRLLCGAQPLKPNVAAPELVIDLQEETMFWAQIEWDVTLIDERKVIASRIMDDFLATMVIERSSGKYWIASVGELITSESEDGEDRQFGAATDSGSCIRPF